MNENNQYTGKLFDNRYLIKEQIGHGGMASVFLAEDLVMKRDVAIKILKESKDGDEQAVKQFINESKAVAMLSHPGIVALYDASIHNDVKYIVMEFVNGITLKKYMDDNGVLPFDETEKIIIKVLSALSHAHSKGIVHRDIKPQNIIIQSDMSVKVADFGIAKLPGSDTISFSDKAIGTANYINPEQASGKKIDVRSDIYSLGVMMYEMVTGKLPFTADSPIATAYLQIHEKPKAPSLINADIPKGLEQIIMKALKKNPENRFQTAAEMLSCIDRVLNNPSVTFDFIFDEDAEKSIFAGDMPREVIEAKVIQSAVTKGAQASSGKPEVKTVETLTDKKSAKKKEKKKEKPEIIKVKKRDSISVLGIVFGILCGLVCVGLVTAYYVFDNYIVKGLTASESKAITVGDFTYMICDEEFRERLDKQGYDVEVEYVKSSDFVSDTVISQDPASGEVRMIGSKKCRLVLRVSSGEDLIRVPNYSGVDYRSAVIKADSQGIKVKTVRVMSENVQEGYIIRSYPESGTIVTKDTEITLYISSGSDAEYITVPDFRGKNSLEVEMALIKYGIVIGELTYKYSETAAAGTVISQDLLPGTTMPTGPIKVNLVVSLGSQFEPVTPPETTDPGTDEGSGGQGEQGPGFESDPDTGFED